MKHIDNENIIDNNEQHDHSESKIVSILKIVSTCLYIAATVCFIVGVVKTVVYLVSYMNEVVDSFEYENYVVSFSFGRLFGYFLNAIVLTVWATLFKIIAKVLAKKDITQKAETFIDKSIDKVSEALGKAVSDKQKEDDDKAGDNMLIVCAYCGSELDETQKKCPYCGSTKKIKKVKDENVK